MPRPTRAQLARRVQELEKELDSAKAPKVNTITITFGNNGKIFSTATTPTNTADELRALKIALDSTLHFVDDVLLSVVRREAESKAVSDAVQPENEQDTEDK